MGQKIPPGAEMQPFPKKLQYGGAAVVSLADLFEQSIHYKPGEVLTHEGDENRDLYILSEGTLEISIKGDDGHVVVGEVHPPEIIGEISFLNGSPRTATITAKTEAEVYILSYYKVEDEMSDIPPWFKLILRTLTQRMQSCSYKIKEMEEKVKKLQEG